MLNDKDKELYSRQITLPEVGLEGQEELNDTGILIVGMGGLGCPVAQYLISSGIGYLTTSPKQSFWCLRYNRSISNYCNWWDGQH